MEKLDLQNDIIFDAGPIISLATNNLLWMLDNLKEMYEGKFIVPVSVREEIVEHPLGSKKFKFEALQVLTRFRKGILRTIETPEVKALAEELFELANHSYRARGNWITIVHYAEMEVLAAAILGKAKAVVIDERTTRMLVEDPEGLHRRLKHMVHTKVFTDQINLEKIKKWVENVRIIRSVELVLIGYEKGLLSKYLPTSKLEIKGVELDPNRILVESLLWGVKLHGCAISPEEIDKLISIEGKQKL